MYGLLLDFDPAVLKARMAENPGAYARILNALCKLSSAPSTSNASASTSPIPEPMPLDFELWTSDRGLWTVGFGLWTLDFGLWTVNSRENPSASLDLALSLSKFPNSGIAQSMRLGENY